MTPRTLAREFRDYPATLSFCLIWIVVFAAMTYTQLAEGGPLPLSRWLLLGFSGGQRFGDLSLRDLGQGQLWRLITCNFIHYSLVHLGLNALAMYQLGTLVESWYGPYQVVLIYGVTGGGGNLIAALIRYENSSSRVVHSGGGSVVILGLMGLCAVVGWRSRTRPGRSLGLQMVVFLILTGLLGILLPNYIDNWGHAGGALIGSALGFAHHRFLGSESKPSAWGSGVLTGLVIAACGAAQFIADRREAPVRQEWRLIRRSNELMSSARDLTVVGRLVKGRGDLAGVVVRLSAMNQVLDGPSRAEVRGLRPLVETALARPLSDSEQREFQERLARAIRAILRAYQLEQRQLGQLRRTSKRN